ncbi:MAG: recombinase RecF [Candidatus Parabeggiatoa sp. nov. 3]|nr:MAG: recombinase RecF [Gammaproteobacteria bacterium]RKZ68582.1 MAG: recombinase RecF [Gammaproteobacteria bacterium]RKZ88329.1 MAG: recombinase RecF [Gammaproteobacteria bacterium]
MLKTLTIENYKSIHNATIELSRINIFIGDNGCGKTNILETLAMASASKALVLDVEGLINRGVRIAKPNLTFSSFTGIRQQNKIIINLELQGNNEAKFEIPSILYCDDDNNIYAVWKDESRLYLIDKTEIRLNVNNEEQTKKEPWLVNDVKQLTEYLIFNLNTEALKGFISNSKRIPLGINGEGLDVLLSEFTEQEWKQLQKYNYLISWLEETFTDKKDSLKFKGYKLGRSNSILYFKDKFMQKKNNVFSAENANDGIVHVLFYLALFISHKTPSLFAIDNIETYLNPRICRTLLKELIQLAKENHKQALITTHNPSVLDGLNLHDDEQKLFVVSRNDDGKTQTKPIRLKPKSDEKLKLSEMWMRGYLGGLPTNF